MADPNTRQGKRTPVTLKIKFKSETLEQFIERYAVDVSQGGIFIRTKEPLAVGTQMRFEFQLRDASPLIGGEGTVVWTRENDPSRPAIAPGMGVRFDRLAEGSQSVLERILAEKAKQQPQRSAPETTRPPMFTDTPTRVAPAPVQEALLEDRNNRFGDQQTPLPRPMPFHSDADEFPEEAFEEATKVRALDELIAQTAGGANGRFDLRDLLPSTAAKSTSQASSVDVDRDLAPVLPSPPEPVRPAVIVDDLDLEPAPLPAAEAENAPGRTRLGLEPAKAETAARSSQPLPVTPRTTTGERTKQPTGATRSQPIEPVAPPAPRASAAPTVILVLLLLAAAGAAVWFFVLRDKVAEDVAERPAAVADAAVLAVTPDASAADASALAGESTDAGTDGGGDGGIALATGTDAAVVQPTPGAQLVQTVITANAPGATVTIAGTPQSGPAPFKASLEKDREYTVQVSARGHLPMQQTVKGGAGSRTPLKLTPKPYIVSVSSTPAGALIYVDGAPTGHSTPYDVTLSKAQAAKKSVRIGLRKAGFKQADQVVASSAYSEGTETMTASVTATLANAPRPQPRPDPDPPDGSASEGSAQVPEPAGSGTPGPTPGSSTSPSGGSTTPAPTTTPTPTGSGSAKEPEPGFMKPPAP